MAGALGGTIRFTENSQGATSRVEVVGNGNLDISPHNGPQVTIGSLEGNGVVFLGARTLTIGSNNQSTSFSGVIQNGGSLTKIGMGTLILSGANTYTGLTTVGTGVLQVDGSILSAVTVTGGALRGSGTTGAVTVQSGGTISPGSSPGILSVVGNLMLSMGAVYLVELNGTTVGAAYDQISVAGMVSLDGATLSLSLAFAAPVGSTFTLINNDLNDPISGVLAGLPEGAVFDVNGQAFGITYHGGDGNDLVVEAVPEAQSIALLAIGAAPFLRRRVAVLLRKRAGSN